MDYAPDRLALTYGACSPASCSIEVARAPHGLNFWGGKLQAVGGELRHSCGYYLTETPSTRRRRGSKPNVFFALWFEVPQSFVP